jgi:hypothetical protein
MKLAKDIGEEMLTAKVEPLSKSNAVLLLETIMLDTGLDTPEKRDKFCKEAKTEVTAFAILQGRLEWAQLKVSPTATFFCAALCDRPGTCVLYAAALKALSIRLKKGANEELSLNEVVVSGFPRGVPTQDELHRIWDGQKAYDERPDNWLDHPASWEIKAEMVV